MFDFSGLRELLIDQASTELEWSESEKSNCEIFTECSGELMYEFKNNLLSETHNLREENLSNKTEYYLGEDNISKWYKLPKQNLSKKYCKILTSSTGFYENTGNTKTIIECFLSFIDDEMFAVIVKHTNLYIAKIRSSFKNERDCNDTNVREIKSLFGLLILMSLLKSKNQNCDELWEESGLGVDVFRLTMSCNRFKFLLRTVRFDNENDRASRKKIDNHAEISEIFEKFTNNCSKNYAAGNHMTICELLIPYIGKCPSDVYVRKNFSHGGIKLYVLIDAKNSYVYNMILYAKEQKTTEQALSYPESLMQNMFTKIKHSLQYVITNTSLSSFSQIKNLYDIDSKMSVIGRIDENSKQIPLEFVSGSNKKPNSLSCGYYKNMSLLTYHFNENKSTTLLCIRSNTSSSDCGNTDHSEVITTYKKALDSAVKLEEVVHKYSVARRTKRHSLSIGFYVINIACLNSFIIYSSNNNSNISRREFLKKLGLSLVSDSIKDRSSNKYLTRDLRENAAKFSSSQPSHPQLYDVVKNKPTRCVVCPRKRDIKVRTYCNQCKLAMCKKHMLSICEKCLKPESTDV